MLERKNTGEWCATYLLLIDFIIIFISILLLSFRIVLSRGPCVETLGTATMIFAPRQDNSLAGFTDQRRRAKQEEMIKSEESSQRN